MSVDPVYDRLAKAMLRHATDPKMPNVANGTYYGPKRREPAPANPDVTSFVRWATERGVSGGEIEKENGEEVTWWNPMSRPATQTISASSCRSCGAGIGAHTKLTYTTFMPPHPRSGTKV